MRLVVILALVLVLEFGLFLSLYVQPASTTVVPLIILLAPTTQTPYQKEYIKQLTRRAAERNVDFIVLDARSDGERQIHQLEYAVAARPDGILLMPREMSGFAGGLQMAKRRGVPVGVVNSRLKADEQALTAFFVGPDNFLEGQMAAELLAASPSAQGVVLIEGPRGQQSSDGRKKGFVAKAAGLGLKVVAERDGEWTEKQAYDAMRDVVSARTAFNAVFAFDDTMALGVLRALREAGRNDVRVVSINGSHEAMSLIADGTLYATVLQSPAEEADLAFDRLLTSGGSAVVDLPATVITRDNVRDNRGRGW